MKKIFKLFPLMGILLVCSLFVGCSNDEDDKSTEALILEMTFEESVVIQQPVINGSDITFYVSADTDAANLKLKPVIKTSDKATVAPASGEEVDFSVGSVEFIVTAEDGVTQTTYNVSCQKVGKYDFEEWVVENPTSGVKYQYSKPIGEEWSTCNPPLPLMMMFGKQVDRFSVTKTEDAHEGTGAARIETLGTKGTSSLYPKVVAGTLFTGKFNETLDMENTLNNTKFGVEYSRKPVRIKGFYKYTSGPEFHRCPDSEKYNETVVEKGTTDECAINAILYDITEDDSYITGDKTYESDRLVARAELKDGTAKAEYALFDLEFEYKYGKTYDPNKKYRLAIICASSKWGDTFSGAPESVLYVDDIEIISE